jgi:hypothetical protein
MDHGGVATRRGRGGCGRQGAVEEGEEWCSASEEGKERHIVSEEGEDNEVRWRRQGEAA